jgi:hypothetical protein
MVVTIGKLAVTNLEHAVKALSPMVVATGKLAVTKSEQ